MSTTQSGLSQSDLAARNALIARQGKGARYDAPNAPAGDLLLARRGAAFFARKLNELTDEELNGPSRIEGWTRAQLIADISYRARSMATSLTHVRDGLSQEENPITPDLALAATLPAQALRHLYTHSDVHLNVEFRDLRDENWGQFVVSAEGKNIEINSMPYLRAYTVWHGAIALNNNAHQSEIPKILLENR